MDVSERVKGTEPTEGLVNWRCVVGCGDERGVKARILITVVTDKFHARRGRRLGRRDRKRKLQELH
jgi:hypothetical protein